MVELVREPKMVMMETFLMAISQTDSRYSSRCWTYILFSSRGDVISCGDRRQGPFKGCLCAKTTHTQREVHRRSDVYVEAQTERGPFTPIRSVKS